MCGIGDVNFFYYKKASKMRVNDLNKIVYRRVCVHIYPKKNQASK